MSYSGADFINDCDDMCEQYGVPEVKPEDLEDCNPETDEGDALRLLAERVGRGLNDRRELLIAVRACEAFLDRVLFAQMRTEGTRHELVRLTREAIARAEGKS